MLSDVIYPSHALLRCRHQRAFLSAYASSQRSWFLFHASHESLGRVNLSIGGRNSLNIKNKPKRDFENWFFNGRREASIKQVFHRKQKSAFNALDPRNRLIYLFPPKGSELLKNFIINSRRRRKGVFCTASCIAWFKEAINLDRISAQRMPLFPLIKGGSLLLLIACHWLSKICWNM